MSDREPRRSPLAAPDAYPRDAEAAGDVMPRVTSLRPTSHRFSQRRLLNGISVALAGVVLLALAIHWLPGMLPGLPGRAQPQSPRSMPLKAGELLPPTRGTNWRSIGPNWGLDIAFTANGALGYVCGALPGKQLTFFAVYDVHQRTWKQFPTPATVGGICRVSVSPTNISDVALIAYDTFTPSESQLFRSLDGGASWRQIDLPNGASIHDIAWTNGDTLFVTVQNDNVTFSVLVSRGYGPLVAIPTMQLTGSSSAPTEIEFQSSGTVIYALVLRTPCSSTCGALERSTDDGRHWSQAYLVNQNDSNNSPVPVATLPNSNLLIGWSFLPATSTQIVLRSEDSGTTWSELPALPINPGSSGAVISMTPDGSVYAWCFAPASVVYELSRGATRWHTVAPLSTGIPVAVQVDSSGHAVALWGQSIVPTSATGLEYYPLASTAP